MVEIDESVTGRKTERVARGVAALVIHRALVECHDIWPCLVVRATGDAAAEEAEGEGEWEHDGSQSGVGDVAKEIEWSHFDDRYLWSWMLVLDYLQFIAEFFIDIDSRYIIYLKLASSSSQ